MVFYSFMVKYSFVVVYYFFSGIQLFSGDIVEFDVLYFKIFFVVEGGNYFLVCFVGREMINFWYRLFLL